MPHISPNNIGLKILNYFLSLFRRYHVKTIDQQLQQQQQIEKERVYSSSYITTFISFLFSISSQILLDSINMIQPINDMDTWSTYFWMKNISIAFTYYLPYYKSNHFKLKHLTNVVSLSSSSMIINNNNSSHNNIDNNMDNNNSKNNNNSISTLIETYPSYISSSSSSSSSILNTKVTLTSPPMMTLMKQLLIIQKNTCDVVHQLDHLRPSEQFAKSSITAQTLYQLIRYSTDKLRSHSILALLSIMGITQEILDHAPSELKRQIFYKSKLGRLIILEMMTTLKTFTIPSTTSSSSDISLFYFNNYFQHQSYQNIHNHIEFINQLNHLFLQQPSSSSSSSSSLYDKDLGLQQQLQILITSLHPPTLANKKGWILDWLKSLCISISVYDKNWTYGNEYEDIISLATQYL